MAAGVPPAALTANEKNQQTKEQSTNIEARIQLEYNQLKTAAWRRDLTKYNFEKQLEHYKADEQQTKANAIN